VIASPPHWSFAPLPLALTPTQVDRVLNAFTAADALRTQARLRHRPLGARSGLEQKFWENFLRVLDAAHLLDDSRDPLRVRDAVAAIVETRTAEEWMQAFAGVNACVSIVKSLREAVESPHFRARGVFVQQLRDEAGREIPALPLPIAGRRQQLVLRDGRLCLRALAGARHHRRIKHRSARRSQVAPCPHSSALREQGHDVPRLPRLDRASRRARPSG